MPATADPHPPLGLRLQLLPCDSEWLDRSMLRVWSEEVKKSLAPQAGCEESRAPQADCEESPARLVFAATLEL